MRRIFLTAVCVLIAFAILTNVLPRAELAETNFQANLIRIQEFVYTSEPKAVLVGSSISGRLLPRYFAGSSVPTVANLGIDGAGPLFGLEQILDRPTPLVIVEANRLCKMPDSNEVLLEEAMRGPLFRAAGRIRFLRAEYRPSSVLYSWLKIRREAVIPAPPRINPAAPQTDSAAEEMQSTVSPIPTQVPLEWEPLKKRARAALRALKERGTHVVIVRMPIGDRTDLDSANFEFSKELSRELDVPEIDLQSECLSRGYALAFTDGIHMTPSSAREASQLLAELVVRQIARPKATL